MAGVARRHPQTAYVGLQKYLQQEWDFVQSVTPGIWMVFQAVEDELRDTFLLDLFQGGTPKTPRRTIIVMPLKQAGIALPDPTKTAGAKWTAYRVITGNLVIALRGTAEFRLGEHTLLMGEGREEIRRQHVEAEEKALG